jgi:hypothetical protein
VLNVEHGLNIYKSYLDNGIKSFFSSFLTHVVQYLTQTGGITPLGVFPGHNLRVYTFKQHPAYIEFGWSTTQVLSVPNVA